MKKMLASCVLVAALSPAGIAQEIMPLSEIKKGMVGIGKTVFAGSEIAEFQVEILGVMENTGPKQNMIIARLSGGPLEKTGVIMGMSGSPVYIGNRVVGAVSSAFPFAEEAIAGVTPIEEMISATSAPQSKPGATGADAPPVQFKKQMTLDELASPLIQRAGAASGASLFIKTPLSFAGFSPEAIEALSSRLSGFSVVPVVGATQTQGKFERAIRDSIEPLRPGSALSVQLVRGDLDLSAVGTVTMISNERVYAFGHPFFNMGPVQFPMARAEVIHSMPNLYASFKIASTGEVVGTMDQDRSTAVAGTLGKRPRMIPVNVNLTTSSKSSQQWRFEIVNDKFLSPILAYVTILSAVNSRERELGQSTLRMSAKVNLEPEGTVIVGDLFAGESGTAAGLASLLATPIYYIMNNPYRDVAVGSIDVVIDSEETAKTARLERIEIDRSAYRPGDTIKMKVHLRGQLEEPLVEEASIELPRSLKPGDLLVYVGQGATLDAMEAAELQEAYYPQTYPQLMRALNSLRKNNRIYFRFSDRKPGIVLRGEDLSDMPPALTAMVGSRYNTQDIRRIYFSPLLDAELATDYAVSGFRIMPIKILSF
ncbi:MAG: SpoIVB peptidase S55 domain-containing protein [Acidobacteriota bacterium]